MYYIFVGFRLQKASLCLYFLLLLFLLSPQMCVILLAKNAKDDVILWKVYVCVESTCVIKSAIKNIFSWSSESMSR